MNNEYEYMTFNGVNYQIKKKKEVTFTDLTDQSNKMEIDKKDTQTHNDLVVSEPDEIIESELVHEEPKRFKPKNDLVMTNGSIQVKLDDQEDLFINTRAQQSAKQIIKPISSSKTNIKRKQTNVTTGVQPVKKQGMFTKIKGLFNKKKPRH